VKAKKVNCVLSNRGGGYNDDANGGKRRERRAHCSKVSIGIQEEQPGRQTEGTGYIKGRDKKRKQKKACYRNDQKKVYPTRRYDLGT